MSSGSRGTEESDLPTPPLQHATPSQGSAAQGMAVRRVPRLPQHRGSGNWPPFVFLGSHSGPAAERGGGLIALLSTRSLSSRPPVHSLTLTCQIHCGPLAPPPGTGWTGPPCRSAENGGSERRQLSDVGERVAPNGKGPILQVRKTQLCRA